ncbi:MAG: ABC transporter substrate-binding protein [Comamonadaceae bacterium]|nr:MAG: ABC transporter substrate-binding protein [Comamonadaceae bacterium]
MSAPSFTRRQFGVQTTLAAAFVAAPAVLRAQPLAGTAGRVRIAVGGQSALYYLPLTVADQLGFFKAEGLDVSLHDHAGGALALQSVQAGAADVCCGAYEHTIRQQIAGHALRSLVLLGRAPQLALGASVRTWPLRSVSSFKGMRVGVSAPGSSTQFVASLWLAQAGTPLNEVAFIGVGTGDSALAALRQGRVHALCQSDPLLTLLEQRSEVRMLCDLRTLKGSQEVFGGAMPGACLYAPQAFVQRQPGQAQALVHAMVHALKWLQTAGPADLARVLPNGHLLGNRAAYLTAFGKVRETLSPDGMMPDDSPATALRAVARLQPELAPSKVELGRTYTNEFVRRAKAKFSV